MVKDTFGTEIKVGNVILLSKGTRGHRDFDTGIVRSFSIGKQQVWIKAARSYKAYNSSVFSILENRHLAEDGLNHHIIVVKDIDQRPHTHITLSKAAELLISSGEFPPYYKLGDAIEIEEETEIPKIKESKKPLSEIDLFSALGMPSSLKKD